MAITFRLTTVCMSKFPIKDKKLALRSNGVLEQIHHVAQDRFRQKTQLDMGQFTSNTLFDVRVALPHINNAQFFQICHGRYIYIFPGKRVY